MNPCRKLRSRLLAVAAMLTLGAIMQAAAPVRPAAEPAGVPLEPRTVYLTFDDGPSPRCTPRLLDGLAEYGARATFFVVGCQTVKDPDIVQRMAAEGHQVGNHSYDHAALNQLTSRQALEDLDKGLLKRS